MMKPIFTREEYDQIIRETAFAEGFAEGYAEEYTNACVKEFPMLQGVAFETMRAKIYARGLLKAYYILVARRDISISVAISYLEISYDEFIKGMKAAGFDTKNIF